MKLNDLDQNGRTYAVVWYCEVDAISEEEAIKKARKFLAPSNRRDWEPLSVEALEE